MNCQLILTKEDIEKLKDCLYAGEHESQISREDFYRLRKILEDASTTKLDKVLK